VLLCPLQSLLEGLDLFLDLEEHGKEDGLKRLDIRKADCLTMRAHSGQEPLSTSLSSLRRARRKSFKSASSLAIRRLGGKTFLPIESLPGSTVEDEGILFYDDDRKGENIKALWSVHKQTPGPENKCKLRPERAKRR